MHAVTRYIFLSLALLSLAACNRVVLPDEVADAKKQLPEKIDFNIHVKPILSDRCFLCHGPDNNTREAGLRLDIPSGAFAALTSGNGKAITPGSLNKSALAHRILSTDPEFKMPPPASNLALKEHEIATLIKWIEQGAEYKPHWAFLPPELPAMPPIEDQTWKANNSIDHFIFAKLRDVGMKPSARADKERLLRRVTLDLTGLPPTIEEIDNYLQDESSDTYEKVVDRLLKSDAYAERMALEWMDVARYADSHGMHADGWRYMWPWRDWVIKSFKNNMPYNEFATWQIAGDLIPEASREQILATAFNRNHPMTAEGGVIDEEFRLLNVFDRTNTTGTAFLGLSLECAKCHDHKFDPISQKNYYQMAAFFNNVKELGMTGNDGNYGPTLLLSDQETDEKLRALDEKIQRMEERIAMSDTQITSIVNFVTNDAAGEKIEGLISHLPFDDMRQITAKKEYIIDGNALCTTSGSPEVKDGKFGNALEFDGGYDDVHLAKTGNFEMTDPFSVSLWVNTTKREKGKTQVLIGNAGKKDMGWRGWDFFLDSANHLSVRLINCLPHNYVHVSATSIPQHKWTHVAFTYDGSGKASGISLYVNGSKQETDVHFDRLYKSIKTIHNNGKPADIPLKIGKSYRVFTGEEGIFRGRLDDIRIFNQTLSEVQIAKLGEAETIITEEMIRGHRLSKSSEFRKQLLELKKMREAKLKWLQDVPEIMVMEEMKEPRPMFVLERGQYDAPKEQVQPGTPETILAFPDSLPKNRLGLAQWLFSNDNPLTARVTVNRYWQMLFGKGLVKTSEDFGNQGSLPSHPELLDWLAISFRESGWDVRALLKLIVMSSTYQQTSVASEDLRSKDPENNWLARGPSHRLQAEMIRDNALAASGLLVRHVGGESVKPYQPEGLWTEKNNFSHILHDYVQDKGEDLYRRSLYTFIRRTSPHPAMIAFDGIPRDVCTVRREITNTPLQPLVLLNAPQFVEAARVLAERLQVEAGSNVKNQLIHAFRLCLGRTPEAKELQIITSLYNSQYEKYKAAPRQAEALLNVGEFQSDNNFNKIRTAALAIVANTLLSHDESYTKR